MSDAPIPQPIPQAQQQAFDQLVEEVIESLPDALKQLVESIAVIVLDRPTPSMLVDLGIDRGDLQAAGEICGMHSGTPDTDGLLERSGELPPQIHLFREGIINLCGGFVPQDRASVDMVREEILVTLLHEIGHQFGLDEDDLEELGYE
jgi:predicted Zn-dependent protease with MMP-like domain